MLDMNVLHEPWIDRNDQDSEGPVADQDVTAPQDPATFALQIQKLPLENPGR